MLAPPAALVLGHEATRPKQAGGEQLLEAWHQHTQASGTKRTSINSMDWASHAHVRFPKVLFPKMHQIVCINVSVIMKIILEKITFED